MDFTAAHTGFVLIAYALTAVVLIGLAVVLLLDMRKQSREVARLEGTDEHRQRRAAPREEASS